MDNKCNIIRDVLPLYVENLASDETKTFVDEHIADCADCGKLLESMEAPSELPVKLDAAPLINLKRKLFRKRIATIVFTSAIVLAIVITGFAFLTSPKYLPYTDDVLSLTEAENGLLICSFSEDVTGYNVQSYLTADGQTYVFHISAWNTVWDEYFTKRGRQYRIIEPADGKQLSVYYSPNNTAEDTLLYGSSPNITSSVTSLPRLVLSYYLILAVMAGAALVVALLIFRKKPAVKLWIERLLLFPVSYIIGHVCIKGFSTATYSSQRDFTIILLVAILIYLACLLGINLYRAKKEGQDVI